MQVVDVGRPVGPGTEVVEVGPPHRGGPVGVAHGQVAGPDGLAQPARGDRVRVPTPTTWPQSSSTTVRRSAPRSSTSRWSVSAETFIRPPASVVSSQPGVRVWSSSASRSMVARSMGRAGRPPRPRRRGGRRGRPRPASSRSAIARPVGPEKGCTWSRSALPGRRAAVGVADGEVAGPDRLAQPARGDPGVHCPRPIALPRVVEHDPCAGPRPARRPAAAASRPRPSSAARQHVQQPAGRAGRGRAARRGRWWRGTAARGGAALPSGPPPRPASASSHRPSSRSAIARPCWRVMATPARSRWSNAASTSSVS